MLHLFAHTFWFGSFFRSRKWRKERNEQMKMKVATKPIGLSITLVSENSCCSCNRPNWLQILQILLVLQKEKGGFHYGGDSISLTDRQTNWETHLISSRERRRVRKELVRSKMMTDCRGREKRKDTFWFGKSKMMLNRCEWMNSVQSFRMVQQLQHLAAINSTAIFTCTKNRRWPNFVSCRSLLNV